MHLSSKLNFSSKLLKKVLGNILNLAFQTKWCE